MKPKLLVISNKNWLFNALSTYEKFEDSIQIVGAFNYEEGFDYYICDSGSEAPIAENILHITKFCSGKIRISDLIAELEKKLAQQTISFRELSLDFPTRLLSFKTLEIKLTEMQAKILRLLMTSKEGVRKQEIAELAFEYRNSIVEDSNAIENHISKLRKALKALDEGITIINEENYYRLQLP